jgi:hypothetical protein
VREDQRLPNVATARPSSAFSKALEQFVQPDGSRRLDNVFRVVVTHA